MNEIVTLLLLAGDKFMKQPGFAYKALKTKKEFKNLCKQIIQFLFIRMIWIKLVFSMIWLMVDY